VDSSGGDNGKARIVLEINPDPRYCTHTQTHTIIIPLPSLPSLLPPSCYRTCDWLGTVMFAVSGCVTAGVAGMDFLGCTVVGTVTAIGGGTIRDMVIGNSPVFWMHEVECE